jgi:hypothetical protein
MRRTEEKSPAGAEPGAPREGLNYLAGERVKLSRFGTFTVKRKHSRRGRDPKTGVPVTIDSRRVLSFKASQVLKDLVAETDGACRRI